jgi:hypothetical protein
MPIGLEAGWTPEQFLILSRDLIIHMTYISLWRVFPIDGFPGFASSPMGSNPGRRDRKPVTNRLLYGTTLKKNSVASVCKRTIPTERPPLVSEVSANFLADRGCHMVSVTNPYGRRSQWPRGLRHELSSPAPTLRSWVRIPVRHGCLCVFCVRIISELKLLIKSLIWIAWNWLNGLSSPTPKTIYE